MPGALRAAWTSSGRLWVARAAEAGFAVWIGATVLSQHPVRTFDRLRRYDRMNVLIPNWRFFAPHPAQHDCHLLYRTLSGTGEASLWKRASTITGRSWTHVIWDPARRREKGFLDLCNDFTNRTNKGLELTGSVAYRLMNAFVLRHIRQSDPDWPHVTGYQFLIVQSGGYEESEELQYRFTSPFVPVTHDASDVRPREPVENPRRRPTGARPPRRKERE
ncbi:hypothetical protein QMZ92_00575 [Streptomyces sp. HNM0645]|uniref:hypothetical protein n=1 Tax=Streptomyces sp. HNM0645 TaxID=2782343 RepID=UPI0024B6DB81|nr:hypothetical protein [Streptomyces sp. HNM0645]MDI9882935.1 hypothetical protein [Streptomyces sp. HNM0645]